MSASRTDVCAEQAIRSWTRRHSGLWTQADEAQLQTWLAASPENRTAYAKVERIWATAGLCQHPAPQKMSVRSRTFRHVMAACAAVVVVALLIPSWRFADRWWNGVPTRWVTERGVPRTLTLEDGTLVTLDGSSELVVKFGAHVRRVALERGEALFTVVHDASRPFEVETGPGRITDLGTRFDVETLQYSTRVAVLEGRVGISTRHGEVLLTAGHSGGYDASGSLLPVRDVDESVAQWSGGQRHFDGEPLAEVVERLARYHDVSFDFAEPRLKTLRVNGTFRITDLALFLRTLSAALPVEAHWVGTRRVEFTSRGDSSGQT